MLSIRSRFGRFIVTLALIAQVFAGPMARAAAVLAETGTAPSCHALASHGAAYESAPAHAGGCCAGGACHCPGLSAAAIQPMPALLVSFVRAAPARAANFPDLPQPRTSVLLRPPIAPLPV